MDPRPPGVSQLIISLILSTRCAALALVDLAWRGDRMPVILCCAVCVKLDSFRQEALGKRVLLAPWGILLRVLALRGVRRAR